MAPVGRTIVVGGPAAPDGAPVTTGMRPPFGAAGDAWTKQPIDPAPPGPRTAGVDGNRTPTGDDVKGGNPVVAKTTGVVVAATGDGGNELKG